VLSKFRKKNDFMQCHQRGMLSLASKEGLLLQSCLTAYLLPARNGVQLDGLDLEDKLNLHT
jgi:hypothetical protein